MRTLLIIVVFLFSQILVNGDDGYKRNPLVDIIHYEFSLTVNDSNNIVHGRAVIHFRSMGTLNTLEFDLNNSRPDGKGMKIDSIVTGEGESIWMHKDNKIIITLNESLKKGSEGIVTIDYHGIPADGLIISNNKYGSRTFFSDHWPNRASNYLPCIDHPYDKATVDFIITTPSHYQVVANGYLVEESLLPGATRLTHWREEVPLATKVMAFGAAPFAVQLAGKADDIPVWSWVFMENRSEGFYDYSVGLKPLTFYSEMVGPYPFEKLANVQSKTIFGGLENAGCIFYAENSVTGQGKAEGLLAHEIAHQWFGNSVTENDWHHVWLSEGFATYLTAVYQENTYGEARLKESMKSARDRVIDFYKRSPKPVIDTTITSLMRLLSANSYQKGAWVLHMLRHEVGDNLFWKGIQLYYQRYRNKNAMTEDFKNVMEEVCERDLDKFFYQWLYVAGQPDLKIKSQPLERKGRTEVTIEQEQEYLFSFNLDLLIKDDEKEYIRKVPVSEKVTKLEIKTDKEVEVIPDPDVNLLFRIIPD